MCVYGGVFFFSSHSPGRAALRFFFSPSGIPRRGGEGGGGGRGKGGMAGRREKFVLKKKTYQNSNADGTR